MICRSYAAKGILPYHGLGSGITRALEKWPEIEFADDRDGCLFTATVFRPLGADSGQSSEKADESILSLLTGDNALTINELANVVGLSTRTVEKQIARLQKDGRLRRIGSRKLGRWEVVPTET